MNVSTFTRREKYKYILGLSALTAVLVLTRTFPLYLFAAVPGAVAALLIVRMRLLKKLTKNRIMQVAFAALIEPIQEYRYHNAGRDENGHPI